MPNGVYAPNAGRERPPTLYDATLRHPRPVNVCTDSYYLYASTAFSCRLVRLHSPDFRDCNRENRGYATGYKCNAKQLKHAVS